MSEYRKVLMDKARTALTDPRVSPETKARVQRHLTALEAVEAKANSTPSENAPATSAAPSSAPVKDDSAAT